MSHLDYYTMTVGRLYERYLNYCEREFEDFTEDIDLTTDVLNLAYTTILDNNDEEHEVQCDYDFLHDEYKYYLDGSVILTEMRDKEDVIEELKNGSFDDFISDGIWKANEILGIE